MIITENNEDDVQQNFKIMVVDDHLILSETLVLFLSKFSDFTVTATTSIIFAEKKIRDNGRYDVILLDYDLPGAEALSGLRRLIEINDGNVALFSGVATQTVVDHALASGAIGFIPKTMSIKTLPHALRMMANDEIFVPSSWIPPSVSIESKRAEFKSVELQIITFLAQGLSNKELARELSLEENIIKMHIRSLFHKLNAKNRTQVVITSIKLGIC